MHRRDQMDGLRALCFLAVFAYHAAPAAFPWGYAGVYAFFALSGFLVAGILSRGAWRDLGVFYARRWLRIAPAYYACLGAVALAGWGGLGWFWAFAGNVQVAATRASPAAPVGHFWTIAVEAQFYLLFPPLFLATPARWRPAMLAGLIVAAKSCRVAWLGGDAGHWPLYSTPVCGEYLLWGCLAGCLPAPTTRVAVAASGAGAAAFAAWTWWMRAHGGSHSGYTPGPVFAVGGGTIDGIGAALMVYGLWWSSGGTARALAWRPLSYLGTISYGLYLYHWPIMAAVGAAARHVPGLWRAQWEVALGLTVAVSAASWRWLERPAMATGRGRTSPAMGGGDVGGKIGGIPRRVAVPAGVEG